MWPCRANAARQERGVPGVQRLLHPQGVACRCADFWQSPFQLGKLWWCGFLLAFLRRVSPGAWLHCKICPCHLGKAQPVPVKPCQGAGGKLHREPFLLKPGSCCFKKEKKKKILCGLWRESARTVQDHDWKAGSLSGHGGFPGPLQPAVDLARMLVPHSR